MSSKKEVSTEDATGVKSEAIIFTKDNILTMGRYAGRVDLLRVLLKPERSYRTEEVDSLIEQFMKGKVK